MDQVEQQKKDMKNLRQFLEVNAWQAETMLEPP